jgi:hypothetical protein
MKARIIWRGVESGSEAASKARRKAGLANENIGGISLKKAAKYQYRRKHRNFNYQPEISGESASGKRGGS